MRQAVGRPRSQACVVQRRCSMTNASMSSSRGDRSVSPKDDDDQKKLRDSRPSGKSFSTSNSDDITPLPPPEPGLPDPRRSEIAIAIRPSQRVDPNRGKSQAFFAQADEEDSTPIPPPNPDDTPDPKSMKPVPREPDDRKKVDRALTHPSAPD